ncbi:unnamed protein product [Pseudo-nitzschia multistriata]|uniref:Uncharacterized protein n=1 Tax=Pseudo-nitzschia multistriata TaxID=183589 RepID=A0A448ZT05_9STRA|nr:unnamed protein product [Pseudo-nitzschia multistriata]
MFAKLLVTALVLWINLSVSYGEDTADDNIFVGNNGNSTEDEFPIDWDYEAIIVVRWDIESPPIVEYDNLQFDIQFSVSDYIEAEKHVRYNVYKTPECGNPDDIITASDGYMETWVSEDKTPIGPGLDENVKKVVTVSNKLNSQTISQSEIYSEDSLETGTDASITYCVLFGLWNGDGPSDPDAMMINDMAVTVILSLDLGDDFKITGQNVAAKARDVEISDDRFFVEAFFCDETGKPPTLVAPKRQGSIVRVCVQPTKQAADVGFRMQSIDEFDFAQGSTSQEAISDGKESSNALTRLSCKEGAKQCFFDTVLLASFYESGPEGAPGQINGDGVATLQWGGEGVDRRLQDIFLDQSLEFATVESNSEKDYTISEQLDFDFERLLRDRTSQKSIQLPNFAVQIEEGSQRPPLKADVVAKSGKLNPLLIVSAVVLCALVVLSLIYIHYTSPKVRSKEVEEGEDEENNQRNNSQTLPLPSPSDEDASECECECEDNSNAFDHEEQRGTNQLRLSVIDENPTGVFSARSVLSRGF